MKPKVRDMALPTSSDRNKRFDINTETPPCPHQSLSTPSALVLDDTRLVWCLQESEEQVREYGDFSH